MASKTEKVTQKKSTNKALTNDVSKETEVKNRASKKTTTDVKTKTSSKKTTVKKAEVTKSTNTDEVKEDKEASLMSTEFVDKDTKNKNIGHLVFNIVFWTVLIVLAFIWIVDFTNVKKNQEPKFCVRTVMHQFTDGTVKECDGIGYNVYSYNRESKDKKVVFSPFFIGIDE